MLEEQKILEEYVNKSFESYDSLVSNIGKLSEKMPQLPIDQQEVILDAFLEKAYDLSKKKM